jgi:hypothetical protein
MPLRRVWGGLIQAGLVTLPPGSWPGCITRTRSHINVKDIGFLEDGMMSGKQAFLHSITSILGMVEKADLQWHGLG